MRETIKTKATNVKWKGLLPTDLRLCQLFILVINLQWWWQVDNQDDADGDNCNDDCDMAWNKNWAK